MGHKMKEPASVQGEEPMMKKYFLMTSTGKVHFRLSAAWRVINNVELRSEGITRTIDQMVSEAIEGPIGTAPLRDLIKPGYKIAIIMDDITRPTPKKEILGCLLTHLQRCGVGTHQIDVLLATGTHRAVTEDEIKSAFGEDLFREVRFVNHDCRSSLLVSVGTLEHAGEVRINPVVARADFRIGVGSILPHSMAGFGGGAKIIFPGVANYEAIRDHHCALMIAKGSSLGNIRENSFQKEICQAGRLAKLDFLVNVIYDSNEKAKEVVAGDFVKAHTEGMNMSLSEFAVRFDERADVTITSAFPHTEGPQITKSLHAATKVTRPGGIVVLYARTIRGGFPEAFLSAFDTAFANSQGDPTQLVLDSCREGKPIVPSAPMDFNAALNLTLLNLSRVNKIILVSRDAHAKQAARMGFGYSDGLGKAIKMVSRQVPEATVNILPAGGLVIPLVEQGM